MLYRHRKTDRKKHREFGPWGERLDSRVLLTGFTAFVTTTLDVAPVGGTLRDAILAVDSSTTTSNSIVFNIPKSDPGYNPATGTFTISPVTELPQITNPVLIDGTTESSFLGEPALVEINGTRIKGPADGLIVAPAAPGSMIDGLEIASFDGSGIFIDSPDNTVGGTASGAGNILVSNTTAGVSIAPNGIAPGQAPNNLVLGNLIGTDSGGASLGNGVGVIIGSPSNTVGGSTSAAANVIGFNISAGVEITGTNAIDNLLLGNFIGTNASGANIGSPVGVLDNVGSNTIGGSSAGTANVFGFNTAAGLQIDSNDELVIGNLFGTNSAGTNLGNAVGVSISGSANRIGEAGAPNTIGFSAQQGISVLSGAGNVISQNLYDGTNGPASPVQANDILSSGVVPTLVSAALSGTTLTLQAYETSTTPTQQALEIYLDTPSRRSFQVSTSVTLSNDPSSPTVLTVTVPGLAIGDNIIATLTDLNNGTSAFSASTLIASAFTVINTNDSGSGSLRAAIIHANLEPGNTITFAIPTNLATPPGTSTFVITPTSPLPTVTAATTIDGTTESGFLGQAAVVQINGAGEAFDGLSLGAGSDGSTITGLGVVNFAGPAIDVESAGDTITGNMLGTDPTGKAAGPGNQVGIFIDGSNGGSAATIGGTASGTANTIGFNTTAGVSISGTGATRNLIIGNFIGADSAGDNLGNAVGVSISGSANTIGEAGAPNTLGFSTQQGISVLSGSGNVISHDLYDGTNGPASPVQANDISLSSGANNGQVAPTLVSAALSGTMLILQAYETSTTPTLQTLEIYLDTPSLRSFLISTSVTLSNDPSNPTAVSVTVPSLAIGDNVIATLTDPTNGTSAFSAATFVANAFIVINTNDSGSGSLRAAIIHANRDPGNTITFAIPTNLATPPGTSTFVIMPNSALPTVTAATTIDGTTESLFLGKLAVVQINGSELSGTPDGLTLGQGSSTSTIKGLDIADFAGAGIHVESSDDSIVANLIGTDASSQNALGNGTGVLLTSGTGNVIGGTMSGAANVISGNFTAGIELDGPSVTATQILGNKIGTNSTGTKMVTQTNQSDPLQARQNVGIVINGSAGNTVGGFTANSCNVICGNYVGVNLANPTGTGGPNLVVGNLIGTNASGSPALGNIVGIYINGASSNTIGGTATGAENTISGNSSVGVEIYGSGSKSNVVEGNAIGLAEGGITLLQNGQFVQSTGIFILNASGNKIGGKDTGDGNTISGNQNAGVYIFSQAGVSSNNIVEGNRIGLASGAGPGPGNNGYGVLFLNAPHNQPGTSGPAANRFGRNRIANFRSLTGLAVPAQAATARSRALHSARPRHLRTRKLSH